MKNPRGMTSTKLLPKVYDFIAVIRYMQHVLKGIKRGEPGGWTKLLETSCAFVFHPGTDVLVLFPHRGPGRHHLFPGF